MTDPWADPAPTNAGDQTIPLVPDAGYAQPTQRPFTEETLVDPLASTDPWASGPGLGLAETADVTATQPLAVPTPLPPVTSPPQTTQPTPTAYPTPAAYPTPTAYSTPAAYPRAAQPAQQPTSYPPYPSAQSHSAPPAQAPTVAYSPQQPYAGQYAEPNGPASSIPGQGYPPYAPGAYGSQQWPALADPVAYDYGYNRPPAVSTHPNAAISMVLGILGITVFSPLAPIAWYLASKGRREMAAEPYRWQPSGMLTAGFVLGIIGTVLMALVVVFIGFFVLLLAAHG